MKKPKTKPRTSISVLQSFRRKQTLVRFKRPCDACRTKAYVARVGVDLLLFQLVDDRIRYDGFQILRRVDVPEVVADPYAEFVETVLARRGEKKAVVPRIRLLGFEQALRDAGRLFPLVAIHREEVDPDVCHIGAVHEVRKGRVYLQEIEPSGCWETTLCDYATDEITRIDFGGGYEDALHVYGRSPSPLTKSS